jgi:hypothetical protein
VEAAQVSDDDLLPDDELRAAQEEADRILAQPAKEYAYRSDYKGGPRNIDTGTLTSAAIELTTARIMIEELDDRLMEAKIARLERIEELLEIGVPVDFVAEHSGLKHRSSVYRAIRSLPRLHEARRQLQQLRQQIRT